MIRVSHKNCFEKKNDSNHIKDYCLYIFNTLYIQEVNEKRLSEKLLKVTFQTASFIYTNYLASTAALTASNTSSFVFICNACSANFSMSALDRFLI